MTDRRPFLILEPGKHSSISQPYLSDFSGNPQLQVSDLANWLNVGNITFKPQIWRCVQCLLYPIWRINQFEPASHLAAECQVTIATCQLVDGSVKSSSSLWYPRHLRKQPSMYITHLPLPLSKQMLGRRISMKVLACEV